MPFIHFISKGVIYWTLIVVSSKIESTSALINNSSLVLALIHNQITFTKIVYTFGMKFY